MFEKEAQEWVKAHTKIENKESYVELKGPSAIESFEAGAEFGYNKANEWHFVKNGDLPKYEEYVLIYTSLKNTYVARIPTQKDYFITNKGGYVQMSSVIAWKEIVLPKESL